MSAYIDIIMVGLFVSFMIFIFVGYHKAKFQARESQKRKNEKN